MDDLIAELYAALAAGDGDRMAACYADDARFVDPVFGELRGREVGGMWRMLTSQADGIDVEVTDVATTPTEGTATWVARYRFGPARRPVVNEIGARYRFADGRITDHVDDFSFPRWARQALGPIGYVAGWTPWLQGRVSRRARAGLDRFLTKDTP
jgi:ketosteroid isomerase-like protein